MLALLRQTRDARRAVHAGSSARQAVIKPRQYTPLSGRAGQQPPRGSYSTFYTMAEGRVDILAEGMPLLGVHVDCGFDELGDRLDDLARDESDDAGFAGDAAAADEGFSRKRRKYHVMSVVTDGSGGVLRVTTMGKKTHVQQLARRGGVVRKATYDGGLDTHMGMIKAFKRGYKMFTAKLPAKTSLRWHLPSGEVRSIRADTRKSEVHLEQVLPSGKRRSRTLVMRGKHALHRVLFAMNHAVKNRHRLKRPLSSDASQTAALFGMAGQLPHAEEEGMAGAATDSDDEPDAHGMAQSKVESDEDEDSEGMAGEGSSSEDEGDSEDEDGMAGAAAGEVPDLHGFAPKKRGGRRSKRRSRSGKPVKKPGKKPDKKPSTFRSAHDLVARWQEIVKKGGAVDTSVSAAVKESGDTPELGLPVVQAMAEFPLHTATTWLEENEVQRGQRVVGDMVMAGGDTDAKFACRSVVFQTAMFCLFVLTLAERYAAKSKREVIGPVALKNMSPETAGEIASKLVIFYNEQALVQANAAGQDPTSREMARVAATQLELQRLVQAEREREIATKVVQAGGVNQNTLIRKMLLQLFYRIAQAALTSTWDDLKTRIEADTALYVQAWQTSIFATASREEDEGAIRAPDPVAFVEMCLRAICYDAMEAFQASTLGTTAFEDDAWRRDAMRKIHEKAGLQQEAVAQLIARPGDAAYEEGGAAGANAFVTALGSLGRTLAGVVSQAGGVEACGNVLLQLNVQIERIQQAAEAAAAAAVDAAKTQPAPVAASANGSKLPAELRAALMGDAPSAGGEMSGDQLLRLLRTAQANGSLAEILRQSAPAPASAPADEPGTTLGDGAAAGPADTGKPLPLWRR